MRLRSETVPPDKIGTARTSTPAARPEKNRGQRAQLGRVVQSRLARRDGWRCHGIATRRPVAGPALESPKKEGGSE